MADRQSFARGAAGTRKRPHQRRPATGSRPWGYCRSTHLSEAGHRKGRALCGEMKRVFIINGHSSFESLAATSSSLADALPVSPHASLM